MGEVDDDDDDDDDMDKEHGRYLSTLIRELTPSDLDELRADFGDQSLDNDDESSPKKERRFSVHDVVVADESIIQNGQSHADPIFIEQDDDGIILYSNTPSMDE